MPMSNEERERLADAGITNEAFQKEEALLNAMTDEERSIPNSIKGPRKKAIAKKCGQSIHDVNRLLKKFNMSKAAYRQLNELKQSGVDIPENPKEIMRLLAKSKLKKK
eukprot:GFYU01021656.1.p2 GENE.GFYU01021656.1~~GFYU01021656.1.p2  ORF type:complete len:108 (-),score=39.22 GFYU01021656.1:19-342(-)